MHEFPQKIPSLNYGRRIFPIRNNITRIQRNRVSYTFGNVLEPLDTEKLGPAETHAQIRRGSRGIQCDEHVLSLVSANSRATIREPLV